MGFVRIDIERNRVFTIPSAMPFYLYQFGREFPAQAREYAAISCGALLESDILSHGPFTSQFQYDDMEKQLPFAKYASQNWGVHLEEAGFGEVMSTTLENNSLLETLSQLLHVSSQSTSPSPRLFNDYPSGFGSRHFAAYFGAETALNKWFTQEDRVAARDSWNRSPFHVCFRSPGLREPHTVYPEFESYCELITGSKEADSGGEPENTESEDDAQLKPFRHETVEKLPWTWASVSDEEQGYGSPCTSMGKFLKKLYILSKDEMKVADIDGRSPLHGFIADWPESLFISLVKTMASNDDEASTNDDDSDSETYSKYVVFPPIDADSLGQTLLDCACQRDERFSYLVFETAKLWPEQINRGIVTAASCGYTELVKHLCEAIESDSGAKDSGLGQAVIEASKRGFTDVIRWLNRMRIDLHAQDSEGMSPLHHAAYGGHTDTVRFLLLEGGDPTQLDNMGRSPLFCGCESGSDKITTLLSEKGASVAQVNKGGQTLLHLAALKGNADVTRRLLKLDYGAAQRGVPDLDTAGPVLQSPLHIAAREGHGAIVKLLVEGGYPILACDADGRTPLSYASEGGHFESVEVLLILYPTLQLEVMRTLWPFF
ncbi:ankyrin repeat-containing domain protein [Nemania sp. FL0031]|nr:ankyrin repeat-containing domain protein [Nemania sp. FL0031]